MNERIKELWVEGTQTSIPREGDYSSVSAKNIEKFAELIVKECCAQVERQYKYATKQTSTWSMSQDVQDMLKKHFGVEE